MPKKTPEQKAKHHNFEDLLRDELYGADIGGKDLELLILRKETVAKIAKRIAKRWLTGPR